MGNTQEHHSEPRVALTPDTSFTHIVLRGLFLIGLAVCLFGSKQARAENDMYQWLMHLGPINFSQGGGAFLPTGILSAMRNGQMSPIMQFVTMNHTMNKCIESVLKKPYPPLERDPYLVAKKKFDYAICRIKKCWQNAMLISMLPLMSGGGGDAAMGPLLAQAFQKDKACDGSGGGGIDPNILILLGSSGS